ncbi:hypothetical protein F1C76_13010 [Geodermatophilaceae bacterium NBWT11]|nr:hypothetical protein F1C76_13010 [Geodermatophilaceae bacterium NBWT11]
MPLRLRPVPELATGPFRGSRALAAGLLTRNELHGPGWERVLWDVYVAAGTTVTHDVRAQAAHLLLPSAVVSGRSAAWLWGVDVDGPDGALRGHPVEVTVPPGDGRQVRGLHIRRRALHPDHIGCVPWMRDVPALWPVHAALELAADPARGHTESVVVLDQFVESAPVTLAQLRAAGALWSGRGCRGLRAALADADGLAGSPPETVLRLAMRAAGLPDPVAQHRLRKPSGQTVKTLDFAWPHLRFAVEYDGSTHVSTSTRPEQRFRLPKDRRVLNEVQELGWQLFYVTAPDPHDMRGLVERIAAALAARASALGVPMH